MMSRFSTKNPSVLPKFYKRCMSRDISYRQDRAQLCICCMSGTLSFRDEGIGYIDKDVVSFNNRGQNEASVMGFIRELGPIFPGGLLWCHGQTFHHIKSIKRLSSFVKYTQECAIMVVLETET